jgi:hypothetical protein
MSSFDAASISLYFIVGMDSAIEGLTLGVLQKWAKVVAILIAIVAHKPVEADTMGVFLARVVLCITVADRDCNRDRIEKYRVVTDARDNRIV